MASIHIHNINTFDYHYPIVSTSGTNMRFNLDLIKRRVSETKSSIDGLGSLALMDREKFLSDSNACDAAKYRLLLAIEATLRMKNLSRPNMLDVYKTYFQAAT